MYFKEQGNKRLKYTENKNAPENPAHLFCREDRPPNMSTNELLSMNYGAIQLPIHLVIHLRNYIEELSTKLGEIIIY